jgi:hypothetical protein
MQRGPSASCGLRRSGKKNFQYNQVIELLRDFIQLPPEAESKETNFLYNEVVQVRGIWPRSESVPSEVTVMVKKKVLT